jgi:hypothetical protein
MTENQRAQQAAHTIGARSATLYRLYVGGTDSAPSG